MVSLLKTADLKVKLKLIREFGGSFALDGEAGTAEATDSKGNVVLRGLQKCRGGHWIMRYIDSNEFKWSNSSGQQG